MNKDFRIKLLCAARITQIKIKSTHFFAEIYMYTHTRVEREQGCSPVSALSHCVIAYNTDMSCLYSLHMCMYILWAKEIDYTLYVLNEWYVHMH